MACPKFFSVCSDPEMRSIPLRCVQRRVSCQHIISHGTIVRVGSSTISIGFWLSWVLSLNVINCDNGIYNQATKKLLRDTVIYLLNQI